MSVAEAANRPARSGRAVKLWLAFFLIIAAGIALAWVGAVARPDDRTVQFRTVQAGTGPDRPCPTRALIEYEGRLDDGTDVRQQRGQGTGPAVRGPDVPRFRRGA